MEDALFRLKFLLADEEMRLHIAHMGFKAVDTKHRAEHRAQAFTDFMCDIWLMDVAELIQQRITQAQQIREKWLRAPYLLLAESVQTELLRKAYLAAAKGVFPYTFAG